LGLIRAFGKNKEDSTAAIVSTTTVLMWTDFENWYNIEAK